MTANRSKPPRERFKARAPKGLKPAGKALWKAIIDGLEPGWGLDSRELHSLERACRCEDDMRALEKVIDRDGPMAAGSKGQAVVHPAVLECRQLRLTQLRLLSALELEDPAATGSRATPASKRARRAAEARWGMAS